jgi:hypothetical protein
MDSVVGRLGHSSLQARLGGGIVPADAEFVKAGEWIRAYIAGRYLTAKSAKDAKEP